VDQSALTGESLPATRKSATPVVSASIIRQGEIGALVYARCEHLLRKTAELVQEAQTVSHFQRAVLRIGTFLIILAVLLVSVITIVSIVRGQPDPSHVAVRPGPHRGRDPRGNAHGAVGHDGGRRALLAKKRPS